MSPSAPWSFAAAKSWARLGAVSARRRGRDDPHAIEYRRAALLEFEIALAEREGRRWRGPHSPPWGQPAAAWRETLLDWGRYSPSP